MGALGNPLEKTLLPAEHRDDLAGVAIVDATNWNREGPVFQLLKPPLKTPGLPPQEADLQTSPFPSSARPSFSGTRNSSR